MPTAEFDDERSDAAWWRPVAGLILLGLAVRTVLALVVPLFPDETYYWEWSRRLTAGYFDHPPGIAYLIASGTALFGDTTAGVRFGSAVAAVIVQVVAALTAYRLGGAGAARRAALLTTVVPLATLGLVLATPDAPLLAFAALTLLALDRALAARIRSGASTMWWCVAGATLGAAFVSKYTAVLIPASLFVACAVHPRLRARFAEPGPYVATIIAALMFAPVVLWNANNDWISFRFQLGHGFGAGAKGNVLTRELELVGGQLALATPILAVLLAAATWRALRDGWRAGAGNRGRDRPYHHDLRDAVDESSTLPARKFALGVMALGPLVFFAISATRRSVEPNWPALAYPAAIVLLASTALHDVWHRWWKRGVVLASVVLAVAILQAWKPILPLAPRKDPIARAHGWNQLATAVDSMYKDPFVGARAFVANGDGSTTRWLAAERYQDASELAYHLPGHPHVFSLNIAGRANQYDLWPTPYSEIDDGDALVASFDANPDGDARAAIVAGWFRESLEGPVVALRRGSGEVAHRKIWLFRNAYAVPRDTGAVDIRGRNR
jgi:4-amino-4-deoxy-L-arabinose transferase-like glycosyltransferase